MEWSEIQEIEANGNICHIDRATYSIQGIQVLRKYISNTFQIAIIVDTVIN